jgi:hypothetical protein
MGLLLSKGEDASSLGCAPCTLLLTSFFVSTGSMYPTSGVDRAMTLNQCALFSQISPYTTCGHRDDFIDISSLGL